MYNQDQRNIFYEGYIRILRSAPAELQEKWDEMIAWTEGGWRPYLHVNVALLPDNLKKELADLLQTLKQESNGNRTHVIPLGRVEMS